MASKYFTVTGLPNGAVEIRHHSDGHLVERFDGLGAEAAAQRQVKRLDQADRLARRGDDAQTEPAPMQIFPGRPHPLTESFIASKMGLVIWLIATYFFAVGLFKLVRGFVVAGRYSQPIDAATNSFEANLALLNGLGSTYGGIALVKTAFSLFVLGLLVHYLKAIAVEVRRMNARHGP